MQNRIIETKEIDWQKAHWLQNDDLKELSPENLTKLKNSLKENHFVMPFNVWQDGEKIWILDGHHRQKALKALFDEGFEVPNILPATFIRCENIQEASKLVLIYSSNYAQMTQEGLRNFLEMHDLDITEMTSYLEIADFSLPKYEQKFDVFGTEESAQNDEIVTLDDNVKILVNAGDMFQLGNHTLLCGDSLNTENIQKLLGGEKIRMLCTDPPYNLPTNFFANSGKTQHTDFAQASGEMSNEEFAEFLAKIMQLASEVSLDGALHFIFMDWRHTWHMGEASYKVYGSPIPKQMCVWNKSIAANGSFYRAKHELCFIYKYGTAKHTSHLEMGEKFRSNVWDYQSINDWSSPDRERHGKDTDLGALKDHPTPKNSKMIADAILDVTNENDNVLELFSGSGTTIIAGEMTNRKVFACEIEAKYVQSTIIRYYNFCQKNNKEFIFKHLNGDLQINDFLPENA
jgi:DNA modification methylase